MGRATLISLLVAAVLGTSAGQAGSGTAAPERVTFIGDSIASVISYDAPSKKVLANGIDLDLQLAVCRRLVGESCPYQGVRPLSLVDLLPTIKIGPTVVVEVGYNDFEDPFADSVEASLQALRKAGAVRVLWLTLRADRTSYLSMNDVIRAAATRHPEMTVVDWNLFSRSHPDWFQDDGLHLNDVGALMMATLIHRSLDQLGLVAAAPVAKLAITTKALPAARVGRAVQGTADRVGRQAADRLDGEGRNASGRPAPHARRMGAGNTEGRRQARGNAARDRFGPAHGRPAIRARRARTLTRAASMPAMPLAISILFFLPFIILGVALLFLLVLFLLARIQNGRFLRPIVTTLSRIPFMKRWFQKMSVAAYERSNPELAGAIKKMQSFGEIKTPEQAQRALAVMTPSERKAYMEMVGDQGAMPEPVNRDQRRRVERGAQGMIVQQRPGSAGRKGKKR